MPVMLPIVKPGENSLFVGSQGVMHSTFNLTGSSLQMAKDITDKQDTH